MKNYLSFIQNPQPFAQNVDNRVSQFSILLLLNSCLVIVISYLSRGNIEAKDTVVDSSTLIVSALLIAPIIEEFIFRSFLNLKSVYSFSIILLMIILLFIANHYFDNIFLLLLSILFVVFVFMFLMIKYHKEVMFFFESKYIFIFWTLTGSFAVFHIYNFTYSNTFDYVLVFLVYLFTSTILGFIRVNYSLLHSILYHFLYNLLIITSDYFLYY
jgi:membrane protease YdiL (CAAX protease family)